MKVVLKRCAKCGGTSMVTARERRCKRRTFGVGSYCCWGQLAVVHRPRGKWGRSPTCIKGDHGWCMNRSSEESHCSCPCHKRKEPADVQTARQKAAQQRLDRARAKLTTAREKHIQQTKELGRTMKRIARLERSVAALERSVAKLADDRPNTIRGMDL